MAGATTDRERLRRLAEELATAASAEPGNKPRRRLPVVNNADAAGLVAMLHAQLDTAIDHRSEAAAAAGIVIACKRGCTACCTVPVATTEAEAVAVAVWLAQPENAEARAQYLAAYPVWRASLGSLIEDVIAADGAPNESELYTTYGLRRAMCPFNHDGACTIYAVRPSMCRIAHAVDTSEHCGDPRNTIQTIKFPEVAETFASQRGVQTLLHAALRTKLALELLPKAVMRRLSRATAFPNQPCPCGSGQKFKSCCRSS